MNPASKAWSVVCAIALTALVGLAGFSPASAATTTGWATWDPLTGTAGAYTTTMQLPANGFPAAAVTSDSRSGSVGVQSGASVWLSPATPVGAKYGSSRDQQYLNLRPLADKLTTPSTTTYTFEHPTPAAGWAFVLGDIDADQVTVSGRGLGGQPLTADELGFNGGFNYCSVSPKPSCTGDATDVPQWTPITGVLLGNEAKEDTSGSAAWFEPTVPVTSLTFVFQQRQGFPVYQTWFASLARDISGTVNLQDIGGTVLGPIAGATLILHGPDGTELAEATSDAEGNYSFPSYTAADGYTVEVVPPPAGDGPGYIGVGPRTLTADLADADATDVDFAVREIVPVPVSGTVLTDDGTPVPGATVTLNGPGGPRTATTDSRGFYLIDDVPAGDYTFSIDGPEGYGVITSPGPLTVPQGVETPSTGNDFELQTPASLSGTVTAGAAGVSGVPVSYTGPDGMTGSTVTDADGNYTFDLLPPGDYTVTVEAPAGYTVDGEDTLTRPIDTDDVTDVNFALARNGAIGGTVTDDEGNPVPSATVVLSGPGGDITLTTDADGAYFTDDLPPGEYDIAFTVPDGYTADGVTERTVTLTSAGESRLDQDFAVTADDVPVPPVTSGGTVTDTEGNPVPGATVTVRDEAGDDVDSVTTAEDGTWTIDLPPATGYEAEVTAPDGYEVDGEAVLTFDVADEQVTGLNFVLSVVPDDGNPTTPPTGPGTPTTPPTDPGTPSGGNNGGGSGPGNGSGNGGGLPVTGSNSAQALTGAGGLLAMGLVLVVAERRRRARA